MARAVAGDTRAALAAITAVDGQGAILWEDGAQGQFVFYEDDLTDAVSADLRQGVYIPPESDTTGASGAWVRQFDGVLNVDWFGAVADDDGSGAFGTDSFLAFDGAFKVAEYLSHAGWLSGTIYRGGPTVLIPSGGYYSSQSLAPLFTGKIVGAGGKGWGAATRIRFPAGVDGLQLQAHNTSGKTTLDGANHYAGDRIYVSDIMFIGAYSGTESDTHGCRAKRAVTLERCTFDSFEGDGLYFNTDFGSGLGTTEGNTNISRIIDCDFISCRRGRYTKGADANACTFIGCNYSYNRQWGAAEVSFLGNHEFGAHFDANARTADNLGTAAKPASYAFNNGHVFACIAGQETWCAANSPPSTATDNTGWYYWQDQGAATVSVPQWAGGMTWRAGGPLYHENANNSSTFMGLHIEGNGVSQAGAGAFLQGTIAEVTTVEGGVMARNRVRSIKATTNGIQIGGILYLPADLNARSTSNFIGPDTGTADSTLYLDNTSTTSLVQFRTSGALKSWFGHVGAIDGMIINSPTVTRLRINNVDIGDVVSGGLDLASGKTYSVGGQKVVGARGSALPADATDLATALTLVNAIKARLKVTGGHGLVAD
jgi:hypothetical protein